MSTWRSQRLEKIDCWTGIRTMRPYQMHAVPLDRMPVSVCGQVCNQTWSPTRGFLVTCQYCLIILEANAD